MLLDETGDGVPLVCMPGGPGFPARHLGTLGGLAANRRLVRVNALGTGGSEPAASGTYSLDDYCQDLDEVVRRLGADDIDLFGHSHGALVAARFAATRDRVRHLVLDAMPPRRADMPTPNGIEDYSATWNDTATVYVDRELSDHYADPYE
jgi:pimeloyl-ACP methyl ester carboxylesterase